MAQDKFNIKKHLDKANKILNDLRGCGCVNPLPKEYGIFIPRQTEGEQERMCLHDEEIISKPIKKLARYMISQHSERTLNTREGWSQLGEDEINRMFNYEK